MEKFVSDGTVIVKSFLRLHVSSYFALIAVVGASVHLAFSPERRSSGTAIAGAYLLYLLFFYVGLMGTFRQMTLNDNHASNNSGIFLVTEIIMPLVILALTLYHRHRTDRVQLTRIVGEKSSMYSSRTERDVVGSWS